MAITIQEQPYEVTRLGQKLIIRATSTNVGNDGFKFVFRVTTNYENIASETDYYVSPNPASQGIFDAFDALKDYTSVDVNNNVLKVDAPNYLAGPTGGGADFPCVPVFGYSGRVYESWLIDGVQTLSEDYEVFGGFVLPASYNVSDGYRPNPENDYGFQAIPPFNVVSTSLMMGDRNQTTHIPDVYLNGITNLGGQHYVAIPTRKSERDWGVLNFLGNSLELGANLWLKYTIKESDGTTTEYKELTDDDLYIAYIPAYPANLNEGGISPVIPANFPNWQWYSIQLFEDEECTIVRSALYVFYPVEDDCIYENVRVCWWSPVKGGFDFFNFTKVSQKSVEVERKRIKKIVGNYANASDGFAFNTSDRGLAETSVTPTTSLEITSDWIQEGEYRLLSNLVRSRYVWIISDEGNATPVVVDTNNFTERRERNGKLSRVTFRLRYSNENFYY